jgi:hypothetical protein
MARILHDRLHEHLYYMYVHNVVYVSVCAGARKYVPTDAKQYRTSSLASECVSIQYNSLYPSY